MRQRKFAKLVVAMLLCGSALTPVLAQTAAPAAAASPASSAGGNDLGTVTVTANRREQSAQTVSGVVQSVSGEQLRKDGISDLRQLQNVIPGMNIANQEGNVEIFIRGVGSSNNTELGDPAAAPHLNGTYIPRPRGLGVMFYDLERVEVNKGPQGTLYGRNAMAGTLNIITAKPKLGGDALSGYAQAEAGNRSSYAAEGALNIPVNDSFALRAAGYYVKKDAGFHNASTGAQASGLKPAGLEENYAGRLSLLWYPTDAVRVSVMGDYGKETGTGYPGSNIYSAVRATGQSADAFDMRQVVFRGNEGKLDNKVGGIQGKVEWDAGPFSVELSGSFRSVDFWQRNAAADGIAYEGRDLAAVDYDVFSTVFWQTKSKSQTYEARLVSDKKGPFKWSTGAFYFKEDQESGFLSLVDKGYCCYSGTEYSMPSVKSESYAIFGDGTLDVTDAFRVFGGARFSQEKKSRYGIGGNIALTLGAEKFDCCFASRFGTEGFMPNLVDRPNFDLSKVTTPAQVAQFLLDSIKTPGARDTLIRQIGSIANGSNPAGTCFERPDINNGNKTCPVVNPSNTNGGFSYANLTIPAQQSGSSKAHYPDFRIGTEYDLTKNNLVYGKIATGHKSGGFNDSFANSPIPETYSPEKVLVYEIGSRNAFKFMDRPAVFNLTGFYYDYKDQVFQDLTCINLDTSKNPPTCTGYSLVNRNIGTSRILGLEAEAKFALPNNFGLDLNATLLDTKIKSGSVADARAQDFGQGGKSPIISLAGNQLPLASKVNLFARLSHNFQLGAGKFDWQALVNYRSAYYLTQFNEADIVLLDNTRQTALQAGFPDRQKGFATVNLGLGYTLGDVRLEAFAANVTNEQASQKALVGSGFNQRFLNDARSYGVRGRISF